jgi:hypothetical protein
MKHLVKKENLLILGGLVFIALFVSMLSPLNPLSGNVPNGDTSVFLTVAQGMLRGGLPYVDFFDHKGPLIYFIDLLGLSIGGFVGVWSIEFLFMLISVFFAYKTARLFGSKLAALMGTAFTFIVMTEFFIESDLWKNTLFFGGGNLTEEYVLPFIFIALYIFIKYYFTKIELSRIQITVLGFCFAASLLLRPNMFAVWAGFCTVIFLRKLFQKDYKTVLRYIIFLSIGVIVLFIPVVLYLKCTGSYDECIRQYLGFNVAYASPTAGLFLHVKLFLWAVNTSLLPVIIALIWLLKKPYNVSYDFYIAYALSLFFSFCLIAIGVHGYLHYCMVLIPLFVPAMAFCFDRLFQLFSSKKYSFIKYGTPILIACILFNKLIFTTLLSIGENTRSDSRNDFIQLGKFIDDNTNENDSITVLGNSCTVYLFTNRPSVSKYIYQTPIASINSKIADDYSSDVLHRKPALIIAPSYNDGQFYPARDIFSPILEMIDEEYQECFKSDRYIIFKRQQ